jgi:Lrp/AsnC family leucine-responsive transcriptional regulator
LIEVKFDLSNAKDLQNFEESLIQAPQVLEAHRTHGESNYLIILIVENLATYDQFLTNVIFKAHGLISVQSNPVLKQFHNRR